VAPPIPADAKVAETALAEALFAAVAAKGKANDKEAMSDLALKEAKPP
jgi:hypothetical protein